MPKRRKLTDEEKAERARERMIDTARQYKTGTYVTRYVAPLFQRMIRAEAGSLPERCSAVAVVDGVLTIVARRQGQCVCVTCGKVQPWSGGIGGMHTGHFLASRRNSILFEEDNVAPQCSGCNRYHSGRPLRFRMWMEEVRGDEVIKRLEKLKLTTSRHFSRDELVDMRIEFQRRLTEAEQLMTE